MCTHVLVSKIKPCICQLEKSTTRTLQASLANTRQVGTANPSIDKAIIKLATSTKMAKEVCISDMSNWMKQMLGEPCDLTRWRGPWRQTYFKKSTIACLRRCNEVANSSCSFFPFSPLAPEETSRLRSSQMKLGNGLEPLVFTKWRTFWM